MYELKKTFIRLDKIRRTLEQYSKDNTNLRNRLTKRDEPLVQKVKKLEQQLEGMRSLHMGQENVLRSLQDQLDNKKEADNAREPPTASTPTAAPPR